MGRFSFHLSLFFLMAIWSRLDAQKNWPEFRGPTGDGHCVAANLPVDLENEKKLRWKTEIHGKGRSSPVIWENQIWLTTATEDGKRMSAICVDFESGKIVFDQVIHKNEKPAFCHPTNSYASPTPVVDEKHVYLHFGSYGTTCLDRKTFKQIWQRKDLECNHHRGPASSPILYNGKLIVAFDGFDLQYVVALNKDDGKTVWKQDRKIDYGTNNGDLMKAYGTGSVFNIDGKPLLIYPSAVATVAYDPAKGDPVWTVYHGGMNASARPLLTKEGVAIWTNGMGRMVAVNPKGKGDITKSNIVWSNKRNVAKKSSPLLIDGKLYMVNDMGILQCLDAKTGERIWQERLGGTFSASPVFDGEKVFALSEQGKVHVFKPGEKFERLNEVQMAKGFKASPAVAKNRLVIRSFKYLMCFEEK